MISIVIPAFNEAERIPKTIRAIRDFTAGRPERFELIVADDGSTDDTAAVVEREAQGLSCRVLRSPVNKGKGEAVRRGVLAAQGDFILFCDADLSTPIEELDKMLAALNSGADVAFGSRALPQSDVQVHQNILRETMGKTFNLFARLLTFRGVHDSQCGFKCFRKEAGHALFSAAKIDGFCFDAEIAYLAQKKGYGLAEVPIVWKNSPQSKVHIVADPLRMFADLLRIRWLHRNDA